MKTFILLSFLFGINSYAVDYTCACMDDDGNTFANVSFAVFFENPNDFAVPLCQGEHRKNPVPTKLIHVLCQANEIG